MTEGAASDAPKNEGACRLFLDVDGDAMPLVILKLWQALRVHVFISPATTVVGKLSRTVVMSEVPNTSHRQVICPLHLPPGQLLWSGQDQSCISHDRIPKYENILKPTCRPNTRGSGRSENFFLRAAVLRPSRGCEVSLLTTLHVHCTTKLGSRMIDEYHVEIEEE